jgi:HD-GYP domain-containing protein (c-di-GMP phosphodiesterase class II)
VRYHHVNWENGLGRKHDGREVPPGSQILHLADRVAVLIDQNQFILTQVDRIREKIKNNSGRVFKPELVDAFINLSSRESFWLDSMSPRIFEFVFNATPGTTVALSLSDLTSYAKMVAQIIDFRSRFTSTHSAGVAASAAAIARLTGFSDRDSSMMEIAGYLHDLGKLVIPAEILEKPGKLTPKEMDVMRTHTYHTYHILKSLGLDSMNEWAAFHHERLDGKGYPFHHGEVDLSLGSRIMAVADVFTAITEDRPYRLGMNNEEAAYVLKGMADRSALDSEVVSLLLNNYDYVVRLREETQGAAGVTYEDFMKSSLQEEPSDTQ